VDALAEIERETGKKVYTILQLRLHPNIQALKKKVDEAKGGQVFDVDLTYITSRGKWYFHSWKGEEIKSGGIATNIGIHFFDMLLWVFGKVQSSSVSAYEADHASGCLELERARINWSLSINEDHLPDEVKAKGKRTFRSLKMDGMEIEFSDGFTELHTDSYREILAGRGFGLAEARPSIELAYQLRQSKGE
jgi:UDP-N-acetyl-2-amino-2-deoxyglucuronate dehydrogenase